MKKRSPFDFRGVVRMTRLGVGFLFFTFVLGFAALNTGNNSLYVVLACMLGTLITSGVVSRRGLKLAYAALETPEEIWAERPADVYVTITNQSKLAAVRDLIVVMEGMSSPVMIPRIGRDSSITVPLRVTFPRRGHVSMKKLDLYTRYPFGLFTKKRRVAIDAEAVVYPRIIADAALKSMQLEGGDIRPLNKPGESQEVFGFREYQSGESVRAVHWKRSISTGRWVVRQGTTESADEVEVALDLWSGGPEDRESFEELVSAAATTVLEAHRSGRLVTLVLPDSTLESSRGAGKLFDVLAMVEPSGHSGFPRVRPGSIVFSLRGGADGWRESA